MLAPLAARATVEALLVTVPPMEESQGIGFLGIIIVGLLAGWIAGLIMKGRGFGILGNIVVGILGALVGGLLFNAIGIGPEEGSFWGSLLVSVIGAIVFLFLVSLVRREPAARL